MPQFCAHPDLFRRRHRLSQKRDRTNLPFQLLGDGRSRFNNKRALITEGHTNDLGTMVEKSMPPSGASDIFEITRRVCGSQNYHVQKGV